MFSLVCHSDHYMDPIQLQFTQEIYHETLFICSLLFHVAVYRGTQSIDLTAKEFDLLEYLLRHLRQMFSRDQILENVWDMAL